MSSLLEDKMMTSKLEFFRKPKNSLCMLTSLFSKVYLIRNYFESEFLCSFTFLLLPPSFFLSFTLPLS